MAESPRKALRPNIKRSLRTPEVARRIITRKRLLLRVCVADAP